MSTLSVFFLIILIIIFCIAIWNLTVVVIYKNDINKFSYPRGANSPTPGNVNLKCGDGKEICIYRATQICTDPDNNNFENDNTDPIDSGYDIFDNYGKYNPQTTVNLTNEMKTKCDKNQNCIYNFTVHDTDGGAACGGNNQLIATYACIPKGSVCISAEP